jgi:hypothetical protein
MDYRCRFESPDGGSEDENIVIGRIQSSRFNLCFFFEAGFIAPDKKAGQILVCHPVPDFNKVCIARGCQVLCNVTGITGFAVVNDANLHYDNLGCPIKKR